MKLLLGVKSQSKPVEVDDYSSETTVFVRENIQEIIEIDPVFKTEIAIYTYDEKQYTFPEWNKIVTDNLKQEQVIMQKQIDELQTKLNEVLEVFDMLK